MDFEKAMVVIAIFGFLLIGFVVHTVHSQEYKMANAGYVWVPEMKGHWQMAKPAEQQPK